MIAEGAWDLDQTIAMITGLARNLFLNHPMAIGVAQGVTYGIARTFSSLAALQGARAEVFRDLEEAHAWLTSVVREGGAWNRAREEP